LREGNVNGVKKMNRKIIVPLAGALALATAMDVAVTSASAAPMGIAPRTTVALSAPVTDVQYRYRRGYRRGYGWGGPALGAAVGLGVLGAAAAAASSPYYGGYGYGYPAYGGYGYGYPGGGCYPGYNC
jgi:hypothetical protein